VLAEKNPQALIRTKEKQMSDAVKVLDFETAAILRDEILVLRKTYPVVEQKKKRK
jgi:protein-arginine kinase activator protein McsA